MYHFFAHSSLFFSLSLPHSNCLQFLSFILISSIFFQFWWLWFFLYEWRCSQLRKMFASSIMNFIETKSSPLAKINIENLSFALVRYFKSLLCCVHLDRWAIYLTLMFGLEFLFSFSLSLLLLFSSSYSQFSSTVSLAKMLFRYVVYTNTLHSMV